MILFAGFSQWLQELGKRLFSAALISLVTVVLFTIIVFVYLLYFNLPPFDVTSLTHPPAGTLCPGDVYEDWVEIRTNGTVVIFIYVTNRTPDGNHMIHPDQPAAMVIPVSGEITFKQSFKWVVPDVPPGVVNQRVLGFRGHDTDEDPLIFGDKPDDESQTFVVATQQQCSAREKE